MFVFIIGGTGVLGRLLLPLLKGARHDIHAPSRCDLDLFNPEALRAAVRDADAIYHLATRIPPMQRRRERDAWVKNERPTRASVASPRGAALSSSTEVYV
jgi:uncharacterized protein YbjT (DUF2867 family)